MKNMLENLDFTHCDSNFEDKELKDIKEYINNQLQQAISCTNAGDWYGLHKAIAEVEFYKISAISRELDLEAERQREQKA